MTVANGLAVVLITRNEATRIRRCLGSVRWADEIIVVDQHSQDDTAAICRACGATVLSREMTGGFGEQKNFAIAQASHPWILSLDADEVVTEELRQAILRAIAVPSQYVGYRMPRLTNYLGRFIRHCGWYPSPVLRLFRKGAGRFTDALVHEEVLVEGPVGTLDGDLLHYSYDCLSDQRAQARPLHLLRRPDAGASPGSPHAADGPVVPPGQTPRRLRPKVPHPARVPGGATRPRPVRHGGVRHLLQLRQTLGAGIPIFRVARAAARRRPCAREREGQMIPAPTDRPAPPPTVVLAAILLLALALRGWIAASIPLIETDGVQYARIAEQCLALGSCWDPLFHPLYPAVIALVASLGVGWESAGRIASTLFGAGLILPAYGLARATLGTSVGLVAAGLLAIHPALVLSGASVLSESTYTFWLVLALWLAYRAVALERPACLVGAGLALGLAYLVRPEVVLYAVGLLALSAWSVRRNARRRRLWAAAALGGVAFCACALPYLLYLRRAVGHWTLSGKVLHNLIQDTGRASAVGQSDFGFFFAHFGTIAWRILENLVLLEKYVLPELFPGLLALLILPGVLATCRRPEWKRREGLLLMACLPPLATLAFHVEARVFLPTLPLLLPLAASGLFAASGWCGEQGRPALRTAALLAVVGLALLPFTLRPILRPDPNLRLYREAAQWISDTVRPGSVVLDRKPFVGFYSHRPLRPPSGHPRIGAPSAGAKHTGGRHRAR